MLRMLNQSVTWDREEGPTEVADGGRRVCAGCRFAAKNSVSSGSAHGQSQLQDGVKSARNLHEYGTDFYSFLASFAVRSAQRIVPKLTAAVQVRSVADFGCGLGGWLSVWAASGASVAGVDGPYVDSRRLMIDPDDFHAADLAAKINLGRQFDLVQSLEGAEHLPASKAPQFVETLTAHGACVLFSAAVPGQGGENHINEQPLGYWRAMFREHGYSAVDYLRPLIRHDPQIARWYRCNLMLYVK